MVSHDDDVDAAMQVHLLQPVHQLTNHVVQLPQRVVQLAESNGVEQVDGRTGGRPGHTHLVAERPQPVSKGVGLL